ncbi:MULTISPECIES: BA14K family protein [unclassified Bartonella]|uniref:BA14K family protein n=1 Tax=unclassified Bartonella TaxID=2645622 RepID=UPI00235FA105|nr:MULTISPECIES: BA14K family protein [unclassified Bartonella]
MCMKKKLYYAFALVLMGSFFLITTNIVNLVQDKSDVEAKLVSSDFVNESSVPLILTGRRELNGFKGYHNYRRGYVKYRDNWWYPEAAFAALPHSETKHVPLKTVLEDKRVFLISSLEKKQPWMPKKHVESCRARYRSYNKNDNSYQPFHGPRKQCLSRFFK